MVCYVVNPNANGMDHCFGTSLGLLYSEQVLDIYEIGLNDFHNYVGFGRMSYMRRLFIEAKRLGVFLKELPGWSMFASRLHC